MRPSQPRQTRARLAASLIAVAGSLSTSALAAAPGDDETAVLGRYFGFETPRFIVVDQGLGPVATGDFNGDGLIDIAVANNRKSRIELHLQREDPATRLIRSSGARRDPNRLPDSEWYDREDLSVSQRVGALVAHDVDGDGLTDLVYSGASGEIVVLRQGEDASFTELSRRRVRGLSATRDALAIADVVRTGDDRAELLAIVEGRIHVFPLSASGRLGEPTRLGTGDATRQQIVGVLAGDFNGDGRTDVLGAAPDDAAPLRVWLQREGHSDATQLGPELRFETPAIRDAAVVSFPGRDAQSIAVIERASNRVLVFDLVTEPIEPPAGGAEREVTAEIRALPGGSDRDRAVLVADIDQDGEPDLLTADAKGNAVALWRSVGALGEPSTFSVFKEPRGLAVGQWDGVGAFEVFVRSEAEKTVGVATLENGAMTFPQPISLATAGAEPAAMAFVPMRGSDDAGAQPVLAILAQDRRDFALELHRPGGNGTTESRSIELRDVRRAPKTILPADVDGDGVTDLLLLTPGEPMRMVRAAGAAFSEGGARPTVLSEKDMPQFGLVQSAGPDNTAIVDLDGDGRDELLIADANFVRAATYDAQRGWRVLEQVADTDSQTRFVGLATMPGREDAKGATRVVASDKTSSRLVVFERDAEGAWSVRDRVRVSGIEPGAIAAGAFGTGGEEGVLALADDAVGLIRLTGERHSLEQLAAWRSDSEQRVQHELTSGDINGDGFTDIIALDAGEKMCSIFTFTRARDMLLATEFEVFQSRLFTGDQGRELQPAAVFIADLTGDGADDLIIQSHDRLIIYPQMTGDGD